MFLFHNHKPTNVTENRGEKKIKRQVSEANYVFAFF